MYVNLETERLVIEPIKADDHLFIVELVNSEGWLRYIGDRNVKDPDDARKYIRTVLENPDLFYNIVRLKGSLEPIGLVTFIYRKTQDFPDIGYALLPGHERNGYAFEAVKMYLDEIIEKKAPAKILAITLPDNQKSTRLLIRLGMGHERDFLENEKTLSLYSLSFPT